MPDFIELTVDREEEVLAKKIKSLREKVNSGGYKYCEDCGTPIPKKRRQVFPAATRCVPCETLFERG